MHQHPIGQLSPSGVLDLGLKCTHSCKFCYYSYWDGGDDQFSGMRKAPWRSKEELYKTIDNFKDWNLLRFDITGGEPTLHPELPDLIRYAKSKQLEPRLITLGQFLGRPLRKSSEILLDELYHAGLREILFSVHATEGELFKEITGESFEKLSHSIKLAEERGINWFSNTVVCGDNFDRLPEIANYISSTQAKVANFIVMKVEFSWSNKRKEAVERKAKYADLFPYLAKAVEIIENSGKPVNIRYGPYCAYKNFEKNVVSFKGVQLDPYEWRNGLRGGKGDGPYGAMPFLFFNSLEEYRKQHPKEVETSEGYNMSFGPPCSSCSLRSICDGVDKDYISKHGWDEFVPYRGEVIDDLMHFRKLYPGPFTMY